MFSEDAVSCGSGFFNIQEIQFFFTQNNAYSIHKSTLLWDAYWTNQALFLKLQFYMYYSHKLCDLIFNDRHTGHQRRKSWLRRQHRPQRICRLQIISPFFFYFIFYNNTQNSLLHLQPVLHCPTPRAWLTAHGKKNTTLYCRMPDSYKSWHAHREGGKFPLWAIFALCYLQLWWARLEYKVHLTKLYITSNIRKWWSDKSVNK